VNREKFWSFGGFSEGNIWVFPRIGVFPQNGWFTRENPIRIDDLGNTPIFGNTHLCLVIIVPEDLDNFGEDI